MNFKKYIYIAAVALGMGVTFAACSDDDLDPNSIFDDSEGQLDPTSPTYQLDKFCDDSLRVPYNCALTYRMKDVMTDKSYNLVPAKYENSVDLAVLCKYYWFDVYYSVVPDKDFLKKYGPRILHFIGSSAVNPANHTEVLGLAESGIKISLYKLNAMNLNSIKDLNDRISTQCTTSSPTCFTRPRPIQRNSTSCRTVTMTLLDGRTAMLLKWLRSASPHLMQAASHVRTLQRLSQTTSQ